MEQKLNTLQSETPQQVQGKKPKNKKKIITVVVFLIIIAAIIYLGWVEGSRWWKAKQEWVRMGLAHDKFPFRMYTERELVEMGRWPVESQELINTPTKVRPEATYAKFHRALVDGDMDKAAECFIKEKQEAWRKSLYEIKEKGLLKEMLNDLPDKLEDTYIYTDDITGRNTKDEDLNHVAIASYYYALKSDTRDRKEVHTMSFNKNWDGIWLIEDL
jgi:hypothetical protein